MGYTVSERRIALHGRTIAAKLYVSGQEKDTAVFCHGFNGSGDDFRREAARLAAAGYNACTFDFCGGSVRETQSGFSTREMTLGSEEEDLAAVVRFLTEEGVACKGRILVVGGSQGGLVAARFAEHGKDIGALALLYPALCIPDDWRGAFPADEDVPQSHTLWGMEIGREYFLAARKIDVFSELGHFAGPVLIAHGDRDEVVPFSYGERAAKLYKSAEFVLFHGEGHGFSPQGSEKFAQLLEAFMGRAFPR